jgi:hypothetical protein
MFLGGTLYETNFKTMSLNTVTNDDAAPMRRTMNQRESGNLITGDIEGAQPRLKGYRFINKPDLSNTANDIDRA